MPTFYQRQSVMFAIGCIALSATGRSENADPYIGLLGTRYVDVGMARFQEHHATQHSDVSSAALNWPIFSHLDLQVSYARTVLKPAWVVRSNIQSSYDFFLPQPPNTPPASNGQTITDSNGSTVTNPADTSILTGSTDSAITIQPKADSVSVTLAWYLRPRGWTPFATASLNRDWIANTQTLTTSSGTFQSQNKAQHDGYTIALGVQVPLHRVVFTAEFTYNDLIKKRDVWKADTRVYGFAVDANLWLTPRIAAFLQFQLDEVRVNSTYNYGYGAGVRLPL